VGPAAASTLVVPCSVESMLSDTWYQNKLKCLMAAILLQIGAFRIVLQAGIASGVRSVEAVVGPAAVEYLNAHCIAESTLYDMAKASGGFSSRM